MFSDKNISRSVIKPFYNWTEKKCYRPFQHKTYIQVESPIAEAGIAMIVVEPPDPLKVTAEAP